MRALFLAAAAMLCAANAAAQTPLIGQRDVARPGGSYARLTAANPAACAQLCAEDGICLAWTHRAAQDGACELKAVATAPVSEIGAVTGLSSRAPEFARRMEVAVAPISTPISTPIATQHASTPVAAPLPVESEEEKTLAEALLGGPSHDGPLPLRARLEEPSLRR